MEKELNFPVVFREGRIVGYGGNQGWFRRKWHRDAGCASTTGANLAAYYAVNLKLAGIYAGDMQKFHQGEYLQSMEKMYAYMKPGFFGYPYARKFARQFVRFCQERGITMESALLEKFHSAAEAFAFVKENIDAGQPVALLILLHHRQELKSVNWHWMTVAGYVEDQDNPAASKIILSNCGKRELVGAEMLFEVHPKNLIRMVSFHPRR